MPMDQDVSEITVPALHAPLPDNNTTERAFFDFLCREICIPLPAKIPSLPPNATHRDACLLVDDYFSAIIEKYSPNTQRELNQIYYGDPSLHVTWEKNLPGIFACLTYNVHKDNHPEFLVYLDDVLRQRPLLRRLVLFHEVGCHLGQDLEYCQKAPLADVYNNIHTEPHVLFLEIVAAALEKPLWNAIPLRVLRAELDNADPRDQKVQNLQNFVSVHAQNDFMQHLSLAHRFERLGTDSFELNRILALPGVRDFIKEAERIHDLSQQPVEPMPVFATKIQLPSPACLSPL